MATQPWDASTPVSSGGAAGPHAPTHATGGTDPLTPADIDAADASHAHAAADVTSGVIDPARLGTGTAHSMTVLRGDGTWDLNNWRTITIYQDQDAGLQPGDPLVFPLAEFPLGSNAIVTNQTNPSLNGFWVAVGYDGNGGTLLEYDRAFAFNDVGSIFSIGFDYGSVGAPTIRRCSYTFVFLLVAALASHAHDAADVTSGVIAPARLGTGTADSRTVLRGDGTWDLHNWRTITIYLDQDAGLQPGDPLVFPLAEFPLGSNAIVTNQTNPSLNGFWVAVGYDGNGGTLLEYDRAFAYNDVGSIFSIGFEVSAGVSTIRQCIYTVDFVFLLVPSLDGTEAGRFLRDDGAWVALPTIPSAPADIGARPAGNVDWSEIDNKPSIPAAQVNSDWTASSGVAQILHKPTIPSTPGDVGAAPAVRPVGTALGTSGTVNLDMAVLHGTIQTIALSGDVTFTTSNRAAGREVTLILSAGGSSRTLTWPSWLVVGTALPTTLASGKTAVVTATCTDTTDAATIAAGAVQS